VLAEMSAGRVASGDQSRVVRGLRK